MGERCTGHCCRVFTLPYDPAGLAEVCNEPGRVVDGPYIADMVIHLGSGTADDLGLAPDVRPAWAADNRDKDLLSHWYTCRHFDGNNCTAYETRPSMCKRYPYGRACEYGACAWPAARCGAVGEGECAPAAVGLEGMHKLPLDWWRAKAPEKHDLPCRDVDIIDVPRPPPTSEEMAALAVVIASVEALNDGTNVGMEEAA